MAKTTRRGWCHFINPKGYRCRKSMVKEQVFCSEHLRFLTRLHVTQVVTTVVSEQMGVRAAEIIPETDIAKHLAADSLDALEIIMELEDAFDISVPDKDVEGLSMVSDICSYVMTSLLSKSRYFTELIVDTHRLAEGIRLNEDKCRRRIETILSSTLFRDYAQQLSLSHQTMLSWITRLIHGKWVERITSIPTFGPKKRLTGVDLIFLTSKAMSHIILKPGNMKFREVPLRHIDIEPEYTFDSKGNAQKIDVLVRLYQQGESETVNFEFEGILVKPTQDFIEKYLELREKIL